MKKKLTVPKPQTRTVKNLEMTQVLLDACSGSMEVARFFLTWAAHDRNATKAYLALHPKTEYNSARVLGSSLLSKVDRRFIMDAYGLGDEKYFVQLKDGLEAVKPVEVLEISGKGIKKSTVDVPDHKVRREYHKALGHIRGIEKSDTNINAVQVNIGKTLDDWGNEE